VGKWHLMVRREMHIRIRGGNLKKTDHSKDLGIDGKTILKWMLKNKT